MKTYEQLMTLVGAATKEEFAEILREKGLRWYDIITYETAMRAENEPGFKEKLDKPLQDALPTTIKAMKRWEASIIEAFPWDFSDTVDVEPIRATIGGKSASEAEEKALELISQVIEEIAQQITIDYNELSDPLSFIGACTVLGINVKNVTLMSLLSKLQNED